MKTFIPLATLISITCFSIPHINAIQLENGFSSYLYFTGFLFLLVNGLIIFRLKKLSVQGFFHLLTLTAGLFLLILVASSHVINSKTIKPLALELKTQLKPDDEIVTYYKYYQDLPIYLERRITIVANWHADDIQYNDNWLREMWYGMPFQDTSAWLIEDATFWQRWNSNKRLFTFMNRSYYKEFSEKAHNRVFKMGEYNDVVLVSNAANGY